MAVSTTTYEQTRVELYIQYPTTGHDLANRIAVLLYCCFKNGLERLDDKNGVSEVLQVENGPNLNKQPGPVNRHIYTFIILYM